MSAKTLQHLANPPGARSFELHSNPACAAGPPGDAAWTFFLSGGVREYTHHSRRWDKKYKTTLLKYGEKIAGPTRLWLLMADSGAARRNEQDGLAPGILTKAR